MLDTRQEEYLESMRAALETHMKAVRPHRYAHSLGVSDTAGTLARTYGVDEFEARAAGLIHDWDKVLDDAELLARAARYGITVVGSPVLAAPVLHGPVAAHELPDRFPELPASVFQAVARHTIGAVDMTPLDMVVFVADAIEPGRKGDYAVRLRELVGTAPLTEVFFTTMSQSLAYVISSGRYLYPPALTVYNAYALKRG